MELSLSVSTTIGMDWAIWKRLVVAADELGFAGVYSADHLATIVSGLDAILALGYVADHTRNIHFGTLVSPVSYRNPVLLTRQAIGLDHLSGGRMILGIGTGWIEAEHTMFGLSFGDTKTRVDRLEEALSVVTSLIRSDEPVDYNGQFFQLQEAELLPRPLNQDSPKLLIGGTGRKRMLPLIARYADIWNGDRLTVEGFRETSALLDEQLLKIGRQPADIKRSVLVPVLCGRSPAEMELQFRAFRLLIPDLPTHPWDAVLEGLRHRMPNGVIGTPDEVVAGLRAYADAGVDEFIIHYRGMDDIEGLQRLAEEVMPYV